MEKKNKSSKVLTIILTVIIVGIIGTLGYIGYTILKERDTKQNYTDAANEFESSVLGGDNSRSTGGNGTLNAINTTSDSREKKYMEGYEIKGTIEIPKVDLKCAILDSTTKRSIEIAVAIMYPPGSDLNKPGNVVIYGHNYRNSLFFSRNDELELGDKIYILDQEGVRLEYEIYNIFETTSTDTTFYTRTSEDTGGKCEVTLSTCTDDAATTDRRLIVQAREVE